MRARNRTEEVVVSAAWRQGIFAAQARRILMCAAKILWLATMLGLSVGAARAEVELVGVLMDGAKTHVMLRDMAVDWTSDWVAVGGRAREYEVVEYKAQAEVLVLRKAGQTIEVPLRKAAVREGRAVAVGQKRVRLEIAEAGLGQPIATEIAR